MGVTRNGARSFLDLAVKLCRLSHMRGFRLGLTNILGSEVAMEVWTLWDPFCLYIEGLTALDDYYNRRDATLPDLATGEDGPFG